MNLDDLMDFFEYLGWSDAATVPGTYIPSELAGMRDDMLAQMGRQWGGGQDRMLARGQSLPGMKSGDIGRNWMRLAPLKSGTNALDRIGRLLGTKMGSGFDPSSRMSAMSGLADLLLRPVIAHMAQADPAFFEFLKPGQPGRRGEIVS